MTDYEKEIKLTVLEYSLIMEEIITHWCSMWLEIDQKTSVTLGNTKMALPLNQKVQLLIDTKFLETTEQWKIDYFFQIRNKFLHVADINSFTECIKLVRNREKFLLEYNKDPKKTDSEADLYEAYKQLFSDIGIIMINRLSKLKERRDEIQRSYVHQKFFEEVGEIIRYYNKEKENGEGYSLLLTELNELYKNYDIQVVIGNPSSVYNSIKPPKAIIEFNRIAMANMIHKEDKK